VVDHIVERFGNLSKIMRATIDDLDDVEEWSRRGPRPSRRPQPPGRVEHPRPLQLNRRQFLRRVFRSLRRYYDLGA
jgi:hypothetical protein